MGKAKNISIKISNKTWRPPSLLSFNTILEVLANTINQEKSIRGIRMGKEELKLLLADIQTY